MFIKSIKILNAELVEEQVKGTGVGGYKGTQNLPLQPLPPVKWRSFLLIGVTIIINSRMKRLKNLRIARRRQNWILSSKVIVSARVVVFSVVVGAGIVVLVA